MLIPYSACISSLEILFASLADCQARVWELDIEGLFETRWRKVQNVLENANKDNGAFEEKAFPNKVRKAEKLCLRRERLPLEMYWPDVTRRK
jgi:hypothetical protein